MAATHRPETPALDYEGELEQDPRSRHLFQVLRRLECAHPNKPRFGRSRRFSDDPVRLRQTPPMGFVASAIESFKRGHGKTPAELSVYSFGLFGPQGPLPLHLTDHAIQEARGGDDTFQQFADVFHHRMMCLFYRAWADAQPTVQRDRASDDRFSVYFGALAGLAYRPGTGREPLPGEALLHYTGHLACPSRHPSGLRSMLADYFQVDADIEEFVGQWEDLPDSCRFRLGESRETGSLGQTLTVGGAIWTRSNRFRIVLGPLNEEDYLRFLPPSESLSRLTEIVQSYVGDELDWDLRLILHKEHAPEVELGGRSQLGFNCWLRTRPLTRDPRDFLISPVERTGV